MDLTSTKTIKKLLLKYNARPSKYMGQNFLIDRPTVNKIIEKAQLTLRDTILEIGPGIGTLTEELAKKAGKIIAVEKDKIMFQILKETTKDFRNIETINTNILKIFNYQLSIFNEFSKKYKVVANIPYYLTSILIRKLLESYNPPAEMILMVQKEVAQRICSKPPKMSLLAVSVQFYAKSEIISYISKECFWPSPKVDSAIIKIIPKTKNQKPKLFIERFFKIVKAGFSHPRKQLVNNLSTLKSLNGVKLDKHKITEWLLKNKINPTQRAETLNVQDWINLTVNFQ